MNVFAVVNPAGGYVTNVVVGDDIGVVSSIVGGVVQVTDATGPAEIGRWWDGTTFLTEKPAPVEETLPPA